MNKKIGFIGLGNMGYPMANNLINDGYDVLVYDIDAKKYHGISRSLIAENICDLASENRVIITMLPNDESLLSAVETLNPFMDTSNIHISMSTVSPEVIERVYRIHESKGTGFISSPVLGRPIAAEKRLLWSFISGKEEIKEKALPIIQAMTQDHYDYGENISSASIIKLGINFMILSAIESMGEAISFVEKNELDGKLFAKMLSNTLFSCPGYKYHAENIANRNFMPAGFRMSLGLKDLQLLKNKCNDIGANLPIANLLEDRLSASISKNREMMDWSAIALEVLDE